MPHRSGKVIKHACQVRQFTRRHLADQVAKGDNTDIGSQYLFDIKVHHHVPAPRFLREMARVLQQPSFHCTAMRWRGFTYEGQMNAEEREPRE